MSQETKWCCRCKEVKSLSLFGRNAARHDGANSYCRECTNASGREKHACTPMGGRRRERQAENAKLLAEGLKCCRICQVAKLLTAFHRSVKAKDGHVSDCKECVRAFHKGLRKLAKENGTIRRRDYGAKLQKKYGITIEEFETAVAKRQGRCDICGKVRVRKKSGSSPSNSLEVDHDHVTGEIRGLLCRACNVALGNLGDSIEGVKRALQYLERHQRRIERR